MVAKTADLPNIRNLYTPDPGYILCDNDLKQADAQVVAWEADDEILKAIFRDPTADLHWVNARDIFGPKATKEQRQQAKQGVHLTNYGGNARTCATALGITIHTADKFQKRWFSIHPKIQKWHESVAHQLQTTRTVTNKFGYRRIYFDRVSGVLPEALAWIPQSTVACAINRAWDNIVTNMAMIDVLLQVHDSLVHQFLLKYYTQEFLYKLREQFTSVVIPYDDPLVIPADIAVSTRSWGEVKSLKDWRIPT